MKGTDDMCVSVVIPTTGRESLARAVESALAQEIVDVEVLVVMNGADSFPDLPSDDRLRVIVNPPGSGGNFARQTGIESANFETIALLDDDDYWTPNKLYKQIKLGRSLPGEGYYIVGSVLSDSPVVTKRTKWPQNAPRGKIDDVQEYLFRRTSLLSPKTQLQSSTLIFPKALAVCIPFDRNVRLHQDWQWVLDVRRQVNAPILIVNEVTVICDKTTPAGVTANTKWRDSIEWATAHLDPSRSGYADFMLGVPLRTAIKAQSIEGVVTCIQRAKLGRLSPYGALYAGLIVSKFATGTLFRWLRETVGIVLKKSHNRAPHA